MAAAATTGAPAGALEMMAAAYEQRIRELEQWVALRTPDDHVEVESQLMALDNRANAVAAIIASVRAHVEAEKRAVAGLESVYHELVQTCAVVTEQVALVADITLEPRAAVAPPAGKENTPRPSDGTPRIPLVLDAEFDAIPKYMIKVRLSLSKVNEAVEALNEVFVEKYRVMRTPVAKMKEPMRRRYQAYLAAATPATENTWFVTEDDIKEANGALKLDTAGRAILCILRHLGRLQENRSKGVIRYIML